MTALLLHGLADLLTVSHADRAQLHFHVEAGLELTDQHIHLHIAGAGEDHLMGLGVVDHGEGGVLLIETVQALSHLIVLAAGLGGDGHRVAGLSEGDALQRHDLTAVAQGIAGLDLIHLGDGADIAAHQLLDLGGLLAPHGIQAAQLLVVAGAGIDHGHIRRDAAGEDLHEGVLAVLVRNGLEHESRGHTTGGHHEFLGGAVSQSGLMIVALLGRGQQLHDVVQQHQGAHISHGAAAQHGEHAQLTDALTEALSHFSVGEVLAVEEALHEFLAGLRHGFLQRIIELVDDGHLILRQLDLHTLAVLHLIGALIQDVHEAGDFLVFVQRRHHNGSDLVAEALTERIKGGVIVAVILVDLGDIDKAGHIPLFAILPRLLNAHGHTVLSGGHDDGGVGGPEGLHHFAGKIECARSIQHVDAAALIVDRRHSGGQRDLTLDLFGIIITNGIAVRDSAHTIDGAGHKQQALCQRSLTAAAVTQQADVTDVLY